MNQRRNIMEEASDRCDIYDRTLERDSLTERRQQVSLSLLKHDNSSFPIGNSSILRKFTKHP